MTTFRWYSDLHGVLPEFLSDTYHKEVCILAGDLDNFGNKGTSIIRMLCDVCSRFSQVVYILGNHEYYGTDIGTAESKIRERMSEFTNFTLLQGGESLVIDGVKIIGATLWSDTSEDPYTVGECMNDYKYTRIGPEEAPWARKLTPKDTTLIHRTHVKAIESEILSHEGDVIVVTHHAPSNKSLDPRFEGSDLNIAYATDIELTKWPKYWIHGHVHIHLDYIHEGCNILCNPGGYSREYTGFDSIDNVINL